MVLCLLTEVNDKLEDLQTSDPFLPPNADTTSTLEIVPVHHNMNQKVNRDGNPLHGGQTNELSVAQESGGAVVIRVEEGQRLLLEEQENGVDQFEVFGQVVELGPCQSSMPHSHISYHIRLRCTAYIVDDNEGLGPSTIVVADSEEDTVSPDCRQQLFDEKSQQSTTDDGQVEIVDHEQCIQLERGAALHDLSASENDNIVGDEHDRSLLDGGHGGHTSGELELARRVSHHIFKTLVEDGP